jgi:16S rRNA C967 or C1407 C5-methylase (RsmB/RsmF family)
MELPLEFRDYAAAALGEEIAGELCSNIESQEELTSVRVNPFKGGSLERAFQGASGGSGELSSGGSVDATHGVTEVAGIAAEPVLWSSLGHYLSSRPVFTLDPLFHAGGYYVQEASSMYMEMVKDAIEKDYSSSENACEGGFFAQKLAALDLCAAPGGKSTHLASLLGEDSLLVSNEVIKSRAVILADNIAKWGMENVVVTNNDPADFGAFEELFDLVVADAPCSGEGLFRKDPQAAGEWSPANVNLCAQRQQRILADIWPSLAPGGYLVYSTCTYNKFENDGNLRFLCEELGAEAVKLVAPEGSGIIETPGGGFQFVPGRVKGEGQYMALVRKNGE